MHDVDKHGIGKVVEMALDHANPNRDRPIHLSFDVDACDPAVAGSECAVRAGHTRGRLNTTAWETQALEHPSSAD
jgi:arginase